MGWMFKVYTGNVKTSSQEWAGLIPKLCRTFVIMEMWNKHFFTLILYPCFWLSCVYSTFIIHLSPYIHWPFFLSSRAKDIKLKTCLRVRKMITQGCLVWQIIKAGLDQYTADDRLPGIARKHVAEERSRLYQWKTNDHRWITHLLHSINYLD